MQTTQLMAVCVGLLWEQEDHFCYVERHRETNPIIVLFHMQKQWYAKQWAVHRENSGVVLHSNKTLSRFYSTELPQTSLFCKQTCWKVSWYRKRGHKHFITSWPQSQCRQSLCFCRCVQEVGFCSARGFGCYAKMKENMIRGGGDKMEERETHGVGVGGGMWDRGNKDGEGGMGCGQWG